MEYNPDKWVMLKFATKGQVTYKILASWGGSYLYGQSWKLNSGCAKIEEDEDYYLFSGYSGSVYRCHKHAYGMTGYTMQIYSGFEEQVAESGGVATMELMPEDTNFMEIVYE
jgi:hypothetical protein